MTTTISEAQQVVPVLYPKDNTLVGKKVNVVLDPMGAPVFQLAVGKTVYPVVDTSTGAHALQGVELEPGYNTITVKVLDPLSEKTAGKDKKNYKVLAWRAIRVFNADGVIPPLPAGFRREPFHTRDRESTCSSCHNLEAKLQDFSREKPENVLCYACHRNIPQGKNVHGPAAVWNCLACHNPDLYPAKYAFSSADPWKTTKNTQADETMSVPSASGGKEHPRESDQRALKKNSYTVKDACLKCHETVLKGQFKHGPAEVGYCTLCHDPHASPNPGWLRKPTWDLCTTCHRDKGSGVHVLVGFTNGTHPTGNVPDPVRPGRNLTCSSCHNPHSAESRQLIIFDMRTRLDLCNVCHKK